MSAQTVNIADVIDGRPIGRYQLGVFGLLLLIIFMDGFDSQVIGYVAPLIIKDFGVAPARLAPVFSAGLFGIMIGSLTLGPVADYLGRRRVILWSAALCGIFTLATIAVRSIDALLALRFLTGLAIGGSFPNLVALTDELAPRRRRGAAVMLLICGISFGSMVGGIVAAQISSHFGWRSVFWVGGLFPFVILAPAIRWLPESIQFLVARGGADDRIGRMLERMLPGFSAPPRALFTAPGAVKLRGVTVAHLFKEGRAPATLLVWTMFFMGLLNIFFMASWLPTILNGVGHSLRLSVMLTALFNGAGIIGTVLVARTEGRFATAGVLGWMYLAGAGFIVLIGLFLTSSGLLLATVACAGLCLVGAQNATNALAARIYPTAIRATGVGWTYGMGRVGSIVGPLVGGLLLSLHWRPQSLFFVAGAPSLMAACAAFGLLRLTRNAAEVSA